MMTTCDIIDLLGDVHFLETTVILKLLIFVIFMFSK